MFDVGFWELVLVGVVALVVIGPERLPGFVRVAGLWIAKARQTIASVKQEIQAELHAEDLRRTLAENLPAAEIQSLIQESSAAIKETINIHTPLDSHSAAPIELNKKPAQPD